MYNNVRIFRFDTSVFNDICLVAIDESTKVDCAIGNDDDDDDAADSSSYNVDDKRGMWVQCD